MDTPEKEIYCNIINIQVENVGLLVNQLEEEFPLRNGNLIHSKNPYRLKKNRQAGEQDLFKLCSTEVTEGAWIYADEDETWYSLGGETTIEDQFVRHTFDYCPDLFMTGSLEFYHIHSLKAAAFLENKNIADKQVRTKISFLEHLLPSDTDLEAFLEIKKNREDMITPVFKIVSIFGITVIKLTGNAENDIKRSIEDYQAAKSFMIRGFSSDLAQPINLELLAEKLIEEIKVFLPSLFEIEFIPQIN